MARPVKNNCDYFPHDSNMRNHRKIKALRTKFNTIGYAIWSMFLEYLTGADGNEFENSDIEKELLSGDFGVSVTEMSDVLNYCCSIELLFEKNGFIYSESLNERLEPVYKKRGKAKEISSKQTRNNGKYSRNTGTTVVTVTEMPQSKVKEIKVNIPFDDFWDLYDKKKGDKVKLENKWKVLNDTVRVKIINYLPMYLKSTPDKKFRKDPQTFLNNKSWEDEIIEDFNISGVAISQKQTLDEIRNEKMKYVNL